MMNGLLREVVAGVRLGRTATDAATATEEFFTD